MSNIKNIKTENSVTMDSKGDLFTFTVEFIYSTLEKTVSYPIYTEENKLIGFFSYKELNSVRCVIDPNLKPLSLFVSSGQGMFFTMVQDKKNSDNFCGIVSEAPVDVSSIKVNF